ncbi:hypothetical protein Tco_1168604 [Tanacetum coccineum]
MPLEVIMVNVIPIDHDHDVPVVEPNQHDDVPVVPEPVLEDEDEDPKEDEFEEDLKKMKMIRRSTLRKMRMSQGESSTAAIPREDGDRLLPGFMRQDIDSFFDLGNEVHSSVEQGTIAMEKLVEKLGNVEEKAECKKLKMELEEARLSNTFLRMQNERVERDLYWTRVRAHEFYQEMIHRGFVFEERPNEAINVLIEDEKSPLSEPQGSPPDV